MRISRMFMVVITSVLLFLITIMVIMNMKFSWVFYLTCIGQIRVVFMLYAVLTGKYTRDKTFEDLYEESTNTKR
ncbi:hypothetical protein [uncultured Aquimarina sp.]|uniref:hypothetical protein n=1 Tax=uncultured Aquimarina sp. TaxID=575652 RepID=UPI00261C7A59|nr:hypothetical protein [uncultured Aquimarina sp.]